MRNFLSVRRRAAIVCTAVFLSSCAGYGGADLKPGVSTLPDVAASMGEPAMVWKDGNGGEQLAYPPGPLGARSFMVFIGADGRLEQMEQVIATKHFARIEPGKSDKDAVQRILGPSPLPTLYSKTRNELAWEWRFMNSLSRRAFFGVLFDGTTWVVLTTYQRNEYPKLFD